MHLLLTTASAYVTIISSHDMFKSIQLSFSEFLADQRNSQDRPNRVDSGAVKAFCA